MSLPGNGIFVVKGEMSILMTAMRRGNRWSSHSHQDDDVDGLMKNFQDLKDILNNLEDLRLIEPNVYFFPFLEVIRSDETTGPVTSIALLAVNKFLSYGLIDLTHSSVPLIVHNIANAITHARFVGTDQSSDGVVLLRILQVLRTLTLAPEGLALTNESLCEIMLSCFRICFEGRLNELLRKTAEYYVKDMVQLVFMRLPQFSEDLKSLASKQFNMKPGTIDQTRMKKKSKSLKMKKQNEKNVEKPIENEPLIVKSQEKNSSIPTTPEGNIVDMQGSISQNPPVATSESGDNSSLTASVEKDKPEFNSEQTDEIKCDERQEVVVTSINEEIKVENPVPPPQELDSHGQEDPNNIINSTEDCKTATTNVESNQEYVNGRGIRFTTQSQDEVALVPYGMACVKELFRFLISLCDPNDKQNTDVMIHLGLTLLTVAFEVGADSIGKYKSLLNLVKDNLCRNLFALLNSERLSVFAADLQVSFLMFESLRTHLKFQLEHYLCKLIEIVSDSQKVSYEHKEIGLDNILQLWRIPGLVTELFLNYDCDMYCSNLYEDLTKLLAKNALSATTGVYHTHLLSLDSLLTVIESIEARCSEGKVDANMDSSHGDANSVASDVEHINNFLNKPTRMRMSENIPTKEELLANKNIKKWLPIGSEHFNNKPKKGIQFLQEHGILKSEFDPDEIALFLKQNPLLDKKVIGEYIGNRNNLKILEAFVKTFDFRNMRIDEALRNYLETFRLPGEAPIIALLLEHFAEHWHKSNGEPFVDVDSAFTLAYAVIMLNVDQHNENAKKQKTPMTCSGFKKNLKGVNGGGDFDEDMLDEIYNTIKNDEIVMPAEQTGLVRENYLWKVLLKKGATKDGVYLHVNSGTYDCELFSIIWGPIVAALSFVFDRSEDPKIYTKAVQGFEKCAMISSHYNLTNNMDMLVLTLAKFTTFHQQQKQSNGVVQFGLNTKAHLALRTVFQMVHQYGDNIREGWKNIFDLILALYSHSLLPKSYIEVEDFIEPSGKITLVYKEVENIQKQDTSLFSSLYSYMVSSENLSKIPTAEEQEVIDVAKRCIKECNLEQLVTDSKFLHEAALLELVNALVELSRGPDVQKSLGYNYNETVTVFFLELLIRVVIQNRDRVMAIWQIVRDHLYTLVMNASVFDYQFLLERSVIGLLRVAIRLMRNEDMSPIVLQSLRMLLLLKSSTLCRISTQISFGLYELLKTSAQNIHTTADWTIIFTLLECVGAEAQPPKPIVDDNQVDQGTKSDGEGQALSDEETTTDRGYTSDSELTKSPKHTSTRSQSPVIVTTSPVGTPSNTGGWILVGNEGEIQPVVGRTLPPNQYNLALERNLGAHDPHSMIKCVESLAFLVRDVAHITPYNFDICVHCIRTFVEASLHGSKYNRNRRGSNKSRRKVSRRRMDAYKKNPTSSLEDEENSDDEDLPSGYHQISIQLLDLMHTLHTRTAQIFKWWAEEGGEIAQEVSLWTHGWCPLLQGVARLCCDVRRQVRMSAITYLQRALLVHDLQTLTGPEWEACFHRVLFPLLGYLLQPINPKDPVAMEETRMRAATLLSKVFLHHLTPLLTLPTFSNLWLIILDFMDKYMHVGKSDLLYEAIPESLKNMLLVMDSAKVFENQDSTKNHLWSVTWERINKFLPNLKDDLFKEIQSTEICDVFAVPENINQPEVTAVQHNVENATRSSIILQPPSAQQQVSSHLFAHLGQMVSTPIGLTSNETTNIIIPMSPSYHQVPQQTPVPIPIVPNSTSAIMQPTLQPGMPYMPNLIPSQQSQQHTFPVLCNQAVVPSTTTSEVQPSSIYAEYLENPYNIPALDAVNSITSASTDNQLGATTVGENRNTCDSKVTNTSSSADRTSDGIVDVNKNDLPTDNAITINTNYFQSAHYFSSNQLPTNIPAGSEFLYGPDQIKIESTESKTTDV